MLFNFSLTPLAKVEPWGDEDHPTLSWFGLTDGSYWLDVGSQKLFAYGNEAVQKLGAPQCVEYQVVRLYEDILDILPYAMEPLPNIFEQLVIGDGALWLEAAAENLTEGVPGIVRSKGFAFARRLYDNAKTELHTNAEDFEIASKATRWRYKRILDSMYLGCGPRIVLWSDENKTHIGWDNRGFEREGVPVWAAEEGVYSLEREEFILEVHSFHERLMDQMSQRVQAVLDGALPSSIDIDKVALLQEQEKRSSGLLLALQKEILPTNWIEAEAAISALVERAKSQIRNNRAG